MRSSAQALAVCTGVLIVIVALSHLEQLRTAYEMMSITLSPNAERASAYGDRHLSAQNQAAYDIDRATYFFLIAKDLDPNVPYLHHQLARIAFLRGQLAPALLEINKQLSKNGTGSSSATSYYVRGLIEGYMGMYDEAAKDYEVYLSYDSVNWAALNDYAWVLLKAKRYENALTVTDNALTHFPQNAWLLNSRSIALFELGRHEEALESAQRAKAGMQYVTEDLWLTAYPGNHPSTASQGVATLRDAIETNIHSIEAKIASHTIQ